MRRCGDLSVLGTDNAPLEGGGHLPNRGGAGPAGPPPRLPRQRRGTTPQMHGRYPDYDVLAEAGHWDEATRRVVLDRVRRLPPIRFFDEREAATLGAFLDVVLAQDAPPRVPVLAMVDEKLSEGRGEGYRYADMPSDPRTWREVARMLDAAAVAEPGTGAGAEPGTGAGEGSAAEPGTAAAAGSAASEGSASERRGFAALPLDARQRVVARFAAGELEARIPVARAWGVVMRDALGAFYSHPWAWSEIGFGGPAYPRGYARLGAGQREPWERPPEFELDPARDVRERGLE